MCLCYKANDEIFTYFISKRVQLVLHETHFYVYVYNVGINTTGTCTHVAVYMFSEHWLADTKLPIVPGTPQGIRNCHSIKQTVKNSPN